MNKFFVLSHPVFVALFFLLALFAHNREQVLYRDLITPLLITGAFIIVAWVFFLLLFRKNMEKIALATSFLLLFFFAYGHAFDPGGQGSYWIRQRYFFPLWTLFFAGGISVLFFTRRDLRKFSIGITLVVLGMNAVSSVTLARYEIGENHPLVSPIDPSDVDWQKAVANKEALPDIYYILPDAYSSTWALREFYDYDNSAFEDFLKEREFYVVPKSRSNYSGTAFTLPSLLNLEYLDTLSVNGVMSRANTNPRRLIAENRVGPFLQALGYTYIHLGAIWEGDFRVPQADENINKGLMSEFLLNLFKKTVIYPFAYHYNFLDDRYVTWERMRYQFDEVAKIPRRKEPTFTFFHLGAPHGPQVFYADGSFIESIEPSLRGDLDDENVKNPALQKKYYPGQLTYVTKRLQELVKIILENSDTPPIIIIQSDHGSSLFSRADPNYRRNRLKNFSAYYLPYGGDALLWEDITPVNTFRVIFNHYFGMNFEMLPDLSFALASQDEVLHPDWAFMNVTEEVADDYKK
ncbi:MAG: hypothetical protein AAB604_02185 [Patescibacteria group bacterium]